MTDPVTAEIEHRRLRKADRVEARVADLESGENTLDGSFGNLNTLAQQLHLVLGLLPSELEEHVVHRLDDCPHWRELASRLVRP